MGDRQADQVFFVCLSLVFFATQKTVGDCGLVDVGLFEDTLKSEALLWRRVKSARLWNARMRH